jgi:hypothetical protein
MGYNADGTWSLVAKISLADSVANLKKFNNFNYYKPNEGETDLESINGMLGELCEDCGLEIDPKHPNKITGYANGKLLLNESLLNAISQNFFGHADYFGEDNVMWRWTFGMDECVEHVGRVVYPTDSLDAQRLRVS